MVRIIKKGSIDEKLHKYLIIGNDKDYNPVFSLKDDAPEDVKEYFPIWDKNRKERNVPCEVK